MPGWSNMEKREKRENKWPGLKRMKGSLLAFFFSLAVIAFALLLSFTPIVMVIGASSVLFLCYSLYQDYQSVCKYLMEERQKQIDMDNRHLSCFVEDEMESFDSLLPEKIREKQEQAGKDWERAFKTHYDMNGIKQWIVDCFYTEEDKEAVRYVLSGAGDTRIPSYEILCLAWYFIDRRKTSDGLRIGNSLEKLYEGITAYKTENSPFKENFEAPKDGNLGEFKVYKAVEDFRVGLSEYSCLDLEKGSVLRYNHETQELARKGYINKAPRFEKALQVGWAVPHKEDKDEVDPLYFYEDKDQNELSEEEKMQALEKISNELDEISARNKRLRKVAGFDEVDKKVQDRDREGAEAFQASYYKGF